MGNMNLVTGYRGANHITADDHGSLNAAIFGWENSGCVLNRGKKFKASVVSNNKITIADGDLIFQGRHGRIAPGNTVSLTIENGTQGYKRIDLIVARYTKNASSSIEDLNLYVIKGTATTGTPSDPTHTEGDIINEQAKMADMPLYRVRLNGLSIEKVEQAFFEHKPVLLDDATGKISDASLPANLARLDGTGKIPSQYIEPDILVVMWSGSGAASHSASDIFDAALSEKVVVLFDTKNMMMAQLRNFNESTAFFYTGGSASICRYVVSETTCSRVEYHNRNIVTVTSNADHTKFTASNTAAEVNSWFNQGSVCTLKYGGDLFYLTGSYDASCMFERVRYCEVDDNSGSKTTAIIEQFLIGDATDKVQLRQYHFDADVITYGSSAHLGNNPS